MRLLILVSMSSRSMLKHRNGFGLRVLSEPVGKLTKRHRQTGSRRHRRGSSTKRLNGLSDHHHGQTEPYDGAKNEQENDIAQRDQRMFLPLL